MVAIQQLVQKAASVYGLPGRARSGDEGAVGGAGGGQWHIVELIRTNKQNHSAAAPPTNP